MTYALDGRNIFINLQPQLIVVGLPRLEKTVNVYTEGTNRNVHVYTSITH